MNSSFLPIFEQKYAPHLGVRTETTREILSYLESKLDSSNPFVIVETGSIRHLGNWEDGQSTIIWDDFLGFHGGRGVTVDLNLYATTITEANTKNMKCINENSIKALPTLEEIKHADLLYLDSYELDRENPFPSAFHHVVELMTVFSLLKVVASLLSMTALQMR